MRVKSKRPKVLFRGCKGLAIKPHLKISDKKACEDSNPKRMTSVKDAIPTILEEPVDLRLPDNLERPSHQKNRAINNGKEDFPIPELFTSLPPIRDPLVTATSLSQDETAEYCLSFHTGTSGSLLDLNSQSIPRLNQEDHVRFLRDAIQNAKYIPYDALRPWVIYWSLTGLSVLGADLTEWQDRVWESCASMQNPSGGFGGGHGQISHAAPSYAVVLSLAMVGGNEALELIDRRAL